MLLTITGLGKTVLLLVAGTFIAWALITAIFIPRRNQRFPRDLNLYITVTAVLFAAQMSAVWWVTGTQEVEEAEAAEVTEPTGTETTETQGTETQATETQATETESTATETEATETQETESEATETEATETEGTTGETETTATGQGDPAAGKQVFATAGCATCHTLADAGSNGTVGPNLDDAQPSADTVVERVTNGRGVMPPFKDQLTEQQIADVAAYVSSVAGQ